MAVSIVVAYDIASNLRRSRLAGALQAWGYRIQESVFQISMEHSELEGLIEEIEEIIESTDDVVHIYRLCRPCHDRIQVLGTPPSQDDGGLYRGLF